MYSTTKDFSKLTPLKKMPKPPLGLTIGCSGFVSEVPWQTVNGYSTIQNNGQRVSKMASKWFGPVPNIDCEVFIGKIPQNIFEDKLIPVFCLVGTLYEFRLMLQVNGHNRGFGFARFTTPAEAELAVKMLNNYEICPNRFLGITFSVRKTALVVKNVPTNIPTADIVKFICQVSEGVEEVCLNVPVIGRSRDGVIYYSSHRDAALGKKQLISESERRLRRPFVLFWADIYGSYDSYFYGVQECGIWTEKWGLNLRQVCRSSNVADTNNKPNETT